MKAWAVAVMTILMLGLAQPVTARPRDPEGRKPRPNRPSACRVVDQPTFGDPLPWRCRRVPTAGYQPVSWRTDDARQLLRDAADAVAHTGELEFALTMQTTVTNVRGGAWTSRSTLTGVYSAPDRLSGVLTIANPWSETQSQVAVADGQARVTHPQTGAWEEGLKLATSYYPVVFTGCLLRMAEADIGRLELVGTEMLNGERVHHLRGPGGARDELEIEYWLGVEDGLPRQATARSGERPGWSDEAHTVRITAMLKVPGIEGPLVIQPDPEERS
jgi:hypothetical protein